MSKGENPDIYTPRHKFKYDDCCHHETPDPDERSDDEDVPYEHRVKAYSHGGGQAVARVLCQYRHNPDPDLADLN